MLLESEPLLTSLSFLSLFLSQCGEMGQYVPRLPLALLPLADRAYTASRINVPTPRVRAIAIPNADPWSGLEEAAVREEEEWAGRADHREVAWEAEAEGGACRTSCLWQWQNLQQIEKRTERAWRWHSDVYSKSWAGSKH